MEDSEDIEERNGALLDCLGTNRYLYHKPIYDLGGCTLIIILYT